MSDVRLSCRVAEQFSRRLTQRNADQEKHLEASDTVLFF